MCLSAESTRIFLAVSAADYGLKHLYNAYKNEYEYYVNIETNNHRLLLVIESKISCKMRKNIRPKNM